MGTVWERELEAASTLIEHLNEKLLASMAEIERLRDQANAHAIADAHHMEEIARRDAEIERLRAERDHWQSLVSRADRALFPFEYKPSDPEQGERK